MSSNLKKIVRNRMLMIVLAIAVIWLGLAAMSPPTTHACPPQMIEYTYYTDSSLTTPCGWKIITCSCGVYRDGCTTSFYTIDYSEC